MALQIFEWAIDNQIPTLNIHDAYAGYPSNVAITHHAMNEIRDEVVRELSWFTEYL